MKFGRLLLRIVIGGLFVGHGTQKLFGWFGGPGIEGFSQAAESMEMRPGRRNAIAAGLTETAGGAMLAAGAATPLAAASLIGTMTTAIRKVHFRNGPWNSNGGYEYNLVLIAALLSLVDGGPGPISVDGLMGWHDTDHKWAIGALAVGAATSTAIIELGRRTPPTPPADAGTPPYPEAGRTEERAETAEPAESAEAERQQ
ncbi:MAG TPA: DoxX family protein [Mycobacteriales bacterium]|nr:DoxX family protein [Mycobacteriales bacterium]